MSQFTDRIREIRNNPSLVVDTALNEMAAQLAGTGDYDVPDPTHPWVGLMECSTLVSSVACSESETLLQRAYPEMAVSMEQLYLHMSDWDYSGRFGSPAPTTFDIVLERGELISKMVDTGVDGIRQLIIPRLTSFTVAGTTFTMQYPIVIRQMAHGGLQITYDTSTPSPVQTLSTNVVDWSVRRVGQTTLVMLHVPVFQFEVTTFTETVNETAGFQSSYNFNDSFYVARVFMRQGNGAWVPIRTTHTEQTYDPLEVTAVLKVVNNTLEVFIPTVYFSQGLVSGTLRIDIYATKGPIDLDLGSYNLDQFTYQLNNIDDNTVYSSPLNSFSSMSVVNMNRVVGGTPPVNFETLRQQVINNTLGLPENPITSAQVNNDLQRRGYSVVTNIDNTTNRQFLATRRLPTPTSDQISDGVGCMMGEILITLEELGKSSHAVEFDDRVTLLPTQLYELNQGRVTLVPDIELNQLLATSVDNITRTINAKRYLYTPFHYVLDGRNQRFDIRPYHLGNPQINEKTFVGENNTTQLQLTLQNYTIEKVETGYRLTVQLESSQRVKELADEDLVLQLSYIPDGETTYASINGSFIGVQNGERVYQFDIDTDYDIDTGHNLRTTNFSMFDTTQRTHYCPLETHFDISFIVLNQPATFYRKGELDLMVSSHLLPEDFQVIARERLSVYLGYALENLWRRNRSVISENSYERYQEDIPWRYEQTIVKTDEDGNPVFEENDEGNLDVVVLHNRGDIVYNDDGEIRYRYTAGSQVLDGNGKPILKEPRKLLREFTLLLLDGLYYFVTDQTSVDYRETVPQQIVDWLRFDVSLIGERLLEQSDIFFYPLATFGDTTAIVRQGQSSNLTLNQQMFVNYYLTDNAFRNEDLKEEIKRSTRRTVAELLQRRTVSISGLTRRLEGDVGEACLAVEAGGIGGVNNFTLVTINDDATRLALGKRAVVLPNQLIAVQDDIDVEFLRHSQR